jgi:3-hydroxybutyryl-CoA dehydrogenase
MQMALYREAISIVEQGIASVEDVDLAIKTGFGLRLPVYGCFEHMDMVGLDLVKAILDYAVTDIESRPESPRLLAEKLAAGDLGVKSGRGFYDWTEKSAAEVRAARDEFVRDFVASRRARTMS